MLDKLYPHFQIFNTFDVKNQPKIIAMKRIGSIALILSLFASCAPMSKEKYLHDYKEFVDEVAQNSKLYSDTEWQIAHEKYVRFNTEYYNKFKDQLTLEDRMLITSYKVQYNTIKAGSEIGKLYQSYLKKDVDKLKKELKYYIDNKMEDDINRVLDDAKKISTELYQELKRIIADIKEDNKK